jgi:hypothetical protein
MFATDEGPATKGNFTQPFRHETGFNPQRHAA